MSEGYPKGLKLAAKERLYYSQYSMEYSIGGNSDNVIKADKYRINLYYSPMKRANAMCDIQEAIDDLSATGTRLIADRKVFDNQENVKKRLNMFTLTFNKDNTIASFNDNAEKKASMLLTAGFFASKTLGVDFNPIQAKNNYGMRDEHEKCFALQKGPMHQGRLRTWSEESKQGRMFICFVGLILASYVRHLWEENEYLQKNFDSTELILAEMRSISCIEHTGRMKFITPFIGTQVKICEAFGFQIPDDWAPVYVYKTKQLLSCRGRPAKSKVEK